MKAMDMDTCISDKKWWWWWKWRRRRRWRRRNSVEDGKWWEKNLFDDGERCDGKKTKEYIETCARMIKLQSQKRRYTHSTVFAADLPCRYLERVLEGWRVWGVTHVSLIFAMPLTWMVISFDGEEHRVHGKKNGRFNEQTSEQTNERTNERKKR